ncbi:MAG: hypothetical protein JXA82_18555 [Sedimentisphaerales bacterium]|nr:hypothetical protein [Sedimentisphaerales bacterium]
MKCRFMHWSVAAVILICIIAIFLLLHTSSEVAWNQLVKRITKMNTVFYRMTIATKEMHGASDSAITGILRYVKLAYDQGIHVESHIKSPPKNVSTQLYVQFDKRLMTIIMPDVREYSTIPLTEERMKKTEQENGDPRFLLATMMGFDYTPLGQKVLNGIKVEGIEVTNTKMGTIFSPGLEEELFDEVTARLWVDIETELPVQLTLSASANDGVFIMDTVLDRFQWNVEIPARDFIPNVPQSYKHLTQIELAIGKEGRDIIDVLKWFARMADGQYPTSLTTMTIANEYIRAMQKKYGNSPPQPSEEMVNNLLKLEQVNTTFATLKKEKKDPAYYGDKVNAQFPHAVLLRWKSDNNQYIVVFGDLSVRQVTTQELVELESTSLNPDK